MTASQKHEAAHQRSPWGELNRPSAKERKVIVSWMPVRWRRESRDGTPKRRKSHSLRDQGHPGRARVGGTGRAWRAAERWEGGNHSSPRTEESKAEKAVRTSNTRRGARVGRTEEAAEAVGKITGGADLVVDVHHGGHIALVGLPALAEEGVEELLLRGVHPSELVALPAWDTAPLSVRAQRHPLPRSR